MCTNGGRFKALNFERGAKQSLLVCNSATRATDELWFLDMFDIRRRIFFEKLLNFAQSFSHRFAKGKRGNTRQNECVRIPGRGWLDTWRVVQVVARCVNGRPNHTC